MGWNYKRVRQLKYSLFLPPSQLLLALALWEGGRQVSRARSLDTFYWPTSALLCYGINAPAVFVKLLAFPVTRGNRFSAPSVSGYGLEEVFFFLGVGILWFLIGRELDKEASGLHHEEKQRTVPRVFANLFSALLGVALLIEGISGLRTPWKWGNYVGNIVESVLFLVWSLILLGFSGLQVARGIRRRTPEAQPIDRNLDSQA
jgi:hypothetical protein